MNSLNKTKEVRVNGRLMTFTLIDYLSLKAHFAAPTITDLTIDLSKAMDGEV